MDLGTGTTTNVSNTPAYYDGPPDWAPDGSALTFRGIGSDIYRWDYSLPPDPPQSILDGGSTVLLMPSFSPDGTKIAFTSGPPVVFGGGSSVQGTPAENQKVWVMDADGTNLDELAGAGDDPLEVAPDWGPVSAETPTPSPTAAGPTPIVRDLVWGDGQCDEEANPVDSLITLRHDAGLGSSLNGCPPFGTAIEVLSVTPAGLGEGDGDPQTWGDVDCGGGISPVDSLKILRYDAGLDVSQAPGCPPIGDGVQIQHAP